MVVRKSFIFLLGLYLLAMIWVWIGAIHYSIDLIPMMAIHIGATMLISAPFFYALPWFPKYIPRLSTSNDVVILCGVGLVLLAVIHWMAIGSVPIVEVFRTNDYDSVGLIRTHIPMTRPSIVNYIPTVVLKAGFPFLIIWLFNRRQSGWAFAFMCAGLFYAISLLQKAYPLFVTIPPAIYLALTLQPVKTVISALLAVVAVAFLVVAANPSLRFGFMLDYTKNYEELAKELGENADSELRMDSGDSSTGNPTVKGVATNVAQSVFERVTYDPGYMVQSWFEVFPSNFPFNYGCGYRLIAPLIGCTTTENSIRVWEHFNPNLMARGYHGSQGAAHFMEEYANFGVPGLVLAAAIAVGVIAAAALISAPLGYAATLALNFAPIMALSSTGLHTTLLSGGWAMILALSLFWPQEKTFATSRAIMRTATT